MFLAAAFLCVFDLALIPRGWVLMDYDLVVKHALTWSLLHLRNVAILRLDCLLFSPLCIILVGTACMPINHVTRHALF